MTSARRAAVAARLSLALARRSLRPSRPTTHPLVSVVIPTYNWSEVLRYAIASALRQTHERLEVLVIGDHCTDDSETVVAAFGDDRVRWHNLAENSGSQSLPNNAGLERARGEIVAYLGHDDLWVPTHVSRLVAAIERSGAAGAYSVCEAIGPPGSNVRLLTGLGAWTPKLPIPPSSVAHRRDAIEEIGGWRDYRTLDEPPDREFVNRLARSRRGIVPVGVLTAFKFNAAWRRDSYRLRRSDEQAAAFARMRHERRFVGRELAAVAWLRTRRLAESLPEVGEAPEVMPPGWQVTQWRTIKGLPDDPG